MEDEKKIEEREEGHSMGSPLSPDTPDIFDIMMRSESRRSTTRMTNRGKKQKVKLSHGLKASIYKHNGPEREEKSSIFRNTLQHSSERMAKTVIGGS